MSRIFKVLTHSTWIISISGIAILAQTQLPGKSIPSPSERRVIWQAKMVAIPAEVETAPDGTLRPKYSPDVTASILFDDLRDHPAVVVKIDNKGNVMHAEAIAGTSLSRDVAVKTAYSLKFPALSGSDRSVTVATVPFSLPELELGGKVYWLEYNLERLKREPQAWYAHCRMAGSYLRQAELSPDTVERPRLALAAEDEARQAIALSPASAVAHYGLGLVYEKTKQLSKAEECYKKAIELSPGFFEAYDHLAWTYALEAGISRNNAEKDDEHLRGMAGAYLYTEGRWVITKQAGGREVWLPRENIYEPAQQKNDNREAKEKIELAVNVLKRSMHSSSDLDVRERAWKSIAQIYRLSGDLNNAIVAFKDYNALGYEIALLTFETIDIKWHLRMPRYFDLAERDTITGILLEKNGNSLEAIDTYRKVISSRANGYAAFEAANRLIALYLRFGKQSEAQELYDSVMKTLQIGLNTASKRDRAGEFFMMGRLSEAIGKTHDAITYQKKAAELLPGWWFPHVELRRIYLNLGDTAAAEKELELIKKTSPLRELVN